MQEEQPDTPMAMKLSQVGFVRSRADDDPAGQRQPERRIVHRSILRRVIHVDDIAVSIPLPQVNEQWADLFLTAWLDGGTRGGETRIGEHEAREERCYG